MGLSRAVVHKEGAVQAAGSGQGTLEEHPSGGTMSTTSYTAEAIQHAIAQGAITEAYQADPQQVIVELNRLRATEVTSYLQ
jgi:hypothetical protein